MAASVAHLPHSCTEYRAIQDVQCRKLLPPRGSGRFATYVRAVVAQVALVEPADSCWELGDRLLADLSDSDRELDTGGQSGVVRR